MWFTAPRSVQYNRGISGSVYVILGIVQIGNKLGMK